MVKKLQTVRSCTVVSPTNLALIKYWGKRDASKLNLPLNSSVSVTLDTNDLRTTTTAYLMDSKPEVDCDRLWVNGKEVSIGETPRTKIVMEEIRRASGETRTFYVVSVNSFPTAAGLASSAAGYAAMVFALAKLCGIDADARRTDLSRIARMGSGSASRSMFGGVVAWNMGVRPDGEDSLAEQICDVRHFREDELHAVICVASDTKKHVSSTSGMSTSVATSLLLKHRADTIVPARFEEMKTAVRAKDFDTIFTLTMRDSNQFHACCLDTYPPIFYMTDVSRAVVRLVEQLNEKPFAPRFAYTFDAGPNAVIFCRTGSDARELLEVLLEVFPPSAADVRSDGGFEFVRGRSRRSRAEARGEAVSGLQKSTISLDARRAHEGEISYFFHTGVGQGVRIVEEEGCALDLPSQV